MPHRFFTVPGVLAGKNLLVRTLARFGLVPLRIYLARVRCHENDGRELDALTDRLDSAEAAVDAQRERLAELQDKLNRANATICDQIDALTNREDALAELRGELAAAEQENTDLRARIATRAAAPTCAAPGELEKARAVLREARHRADLFDALAVLLDNDAWGAYHAAGEPSLADPQTKWHLGQAASLQAFKLSVLDLIAADEEPAAPVAD